MNSLGINSYLYNCVCYNFQESFFKWIISQRSNPSTFHLNETILDKNVAWNKIKRTSFGTVYYIKQNNKWQLCFFIKCISTNQFICMSHGKQIWTCFKSNDHEKYNNRTFSVITVKQNISFIFKISAMQQ